MQCRSHICKRKSFSVTEELQKHLSDKNTMKQQSKDKTVDRYEGFVESTTFCIVQLSDAT